MTLLYLDAFDPCILSKPDQIYYVPLTAPLPKEFHSGSGEYYYVKVCGHFVVDIYMATYSATGPIVDGVKMGPGKVRILATPYDLPSSSSFGGYIPVVQEDCNRLMYSVRFYRKLADQSSFDLMKTSKQTGVWFSGKCDFPISIKGKNYIDASVSQGGWDIYRVAVQVHLRSSAQEVSVSIVPTPAQ